MGGLNFLGGLMFIKDNVFVFYLNGLIFDNLIFVRRWVLLFSIILKVGFNW